MGDKSCGLPVRLKIADFGLARTICNPKDCMTCTGSPNYMAPEVRNRRWKSDAYSGYGKPVDMWSLGLVLYAMLSAEPAFSDDSGDRVLEEHYGFQSCCWDGVSEMAKDLIRRLAV